SRANGGGSSAEGGGSCGGQRGSANAGGGATNSGWGPATVNAEDFVQVFLSNHKERLESDGYLRVKREARPLVKLRFISLLYVCNHHGVKERVLTYLYADLVLNTGLEVVSSSDGSGSTVTILRRITGTLYRCLRRVSQLAL